MYAVLERIPVNQGLLKTLNEINHTNKKTNEDMNLMNKNMNEDMNHVSKKMNEDMTHLSKKMNENMNHLSKKMNENMNNLSKKMNENMNQMNENLIDIKSTLKVHSLYHEGHVKEFKRIDIKLDQVKTGLGSGLEKLCLEALITKLKSQNLKCKQSV